MGADGIGGVHPAPVGKEAGQTVMAKEREEAAGGTKLDRVAGHTPEALKEIRATLLAEVDAIQVTRIRADSVFLRRILVRSTFAYVEGTLWVVKQLVAQLGKVTAAERAFLEEREYRLDDRGVLREDSLKISLWNNVAFTMRCGLNAFGAAHIDPKAPQEGYQAFREAVKLRDRLTHPKCAATLDVTKDDVEMVTKGAQWFDGKTREVVHACQQHFDEIRAKAGLPPETEEPRPNYQAERYLVGLCPDAPFAPLPTFARFALLGQEEHDTATADMPQHP
jgi:hypothetical protein